MKNTSIEDGLDHWYLNDPNGDSYLATDENVGTLFLGKLWR